MKEGDVSFTSDDVDTKQQENKECVMTDLSDVYFMQPETVDGDLPQLSDDINVEQLEADKGATAHISDEAGDLPQSYDDVNVEQLEADKGATDHISDEAEAKRREAKERKKREKRELLHYTDSEPDDSTEDQVEGLGASKSSSSVDSEELNFIRRTIQKINMQPALWELQRQKTCGEKKCSPEKPEEKKSECIIKIDDEMYTCDKDILSQYCLLFESGINERVIDLSTLNISQDGFVDTYMWMYERQEIPNIIRKENIVELYKTAVLLNIPSMKQEICKIISEQFDQDSLLAVLSEVVDKNYYDILKDVFNFITSKINITKFLTSEWFVSVSFDLMEKLFSSDFLQLHSEKEVMYAVIFWLTYDWESRKKYATSLIGCARLGLLEPIQIIKMKHEKEIENLLVEEEIVEIIDDCLAYSVYNKDYKDNVKKVTRFCKSRHIPIPQARQTYKTDTQPGYTNYLEFLQLIQNSKQI